MDASAYVDGLVAAVDVRIVSNSVLNIAVGLLVSYLYNVAVCLFISCIFLTITMYSQRMHIKRLKWSYPLRVHLLFLSCNCHSQMFELFITS